MGSDTNVNRLDAASSDAITVRYEIEDGDLPSVALVTVIAALSGGEPTEVAPLYQHVDLESLDRLMARESGPSPWSTSVRLDFDHYTFTISETEIVVVDATGGDRDRGVQTEP